MRSILTVTNFAHPRGEGLKVETSMPLSEDDRGVKNLVQLSEVLGK